MDLSDVANGVKLGNLIEEVADFLCRPRREVRGRSLAR